MYDNFYTLENLRLSQTSLTSPLNYSRSSIPQANRLSTVSLQEQYDPSRVLEDFKILPFSQWNTRALVAWMELVVGKQIRLYVSANTSNYHFYMC